MFALDNQPPENTFVHRLDHWIIRIKLTFNGWTFCISRSHDSLAASKKGYKTPTKALSKAKRVCQLLDRHTEIEDILSDLLESDRLKQEEYTQLSRLVSEMLEDLV